MKTNDDAIQFTQELVADIWEEHQNQARLRECAEELWEKQRAEAREAERDERLEEFIWQSLDVSIDEARVIAALVRQKARDTAPPVSLGRRESKNRMFK